MLVLVTLSGLGLAGLLAVVAGSTRAPREIVVVARDMAFYLEGDVRPNPTIRMTAGEDVRLILRNEEPGVTHDFVIGAWRVATPLLHGHETASVEFRAPDRPGRHEYLCSPHSQMMRGAIDVIDVR